MRMVSCDLKALWYYVHEKNMHKILVFDRGFPQIPIARSGILKIPSGSTPCPRGFSKSPPGSGDLGENPLPKTRISYINFKMWAPI